VLDLVDMYLRKQPSNPLAVRFILPLVDLVTRSTNDERQLSDKARGILNLRISKAKEIPSGVDQEVAVAIATNLHERAQHAPSSAILPILSQCSLYLSRILSQQNSKPSIDMYRSSLSDFLTRKQSGLNTAFFQDFIKKFPAQAWEFRSDFLTLSEKGVNVYRRSQIIHLLECLFLQIPSMVRVGLDSK
jgi:DNA polymerase phi